ncbi:hypothetical protein R3P38DRAFT_2656056 [Favolaschia claudopus]|uniref:DUF6534 domain-containing protein n=1 Tax=Favolaschia claudopus TaxID=2862362 RepID=A0AAV9ZWX0_9AGAR
MASTPENVKLLLGPIFAGTALNIFLFGICAAQFTTYFVSARRRQDTLIIRILVVWEFLLSIFCAVVSAYFVWLYLVENYFNPAFLASAPWPLTAVPLLSGLSACPVQIFMAHRVFRLSKSRFLFVLMVFLTFSNGCIAAATSVLAFGLKFDQGSRLTPVVDSWLAVTVANDLIVTLLLIYYLHKSRTGFNKTNHLITRLIRSALESAVFATFLSIMVLIMFTVFPRTGFHLMFSQPMGRIYTAAERSLQTLNGRESLCHDVYESHFVDAEQLDLRPIRPPVRPFLHYLLLLLNSNQGISKITVESNDDK